MCPLRASSQCTECLATDFQGIATRLSLAGLYSLFLSERQKGLFIL